MITLAILCISLGYLVAYSSSKKTTIQLPFLSNKSIRNQKNIAVILLCIAILPFVYIYGFGSGTLFYCIAVMTIASCIAIFYPLQILKPIAFFTIALSTLIEIACYAC